MSVKIMSAVKATKFIRDESNPVPVSHCKSLALETQLHEAPDESQRPGVDIVC